MKQLTFQFPASDTTNIRVYTFASGSSILWGLKFPNGDRQYIARMSLYNRQFTTARIYFSTNLQSILGLEYGERFPTQEGYPFGSKTRDEEVRYIGDTDGYRIVDHFDDGLRFIASDNGSDEIHVDLTDNSGLYVWLFTIAPHKIMLNEIDSYSAGHFGLNLENGYLKVENRT